MAYDLPEFVLFQIFNYFVNKGDKEYKDYIGFYEFKVNLLRLVSRRVKNEMVPKFLIERVVVPSIHDLEKFVRLLDMGIGFIRVSSRVLKTSMRSDKEKPQTLLANLRRFVFYRHDRAKSDYSDPTSVYNQELAMCTDSHLRNNIYNYFNSRSEKLWLRHNRLFSDIYLFAESHNSEFPCHWKKGYFMKGVGQLPKSLDVTYLTLCISMANNIPAVPSARHLTLIYLYQTNGKLADQDLSVYFPALESLRLSGEQHAQENWQPICRIVNRCQTISRLEISHITLRTSEEAEVPINSFNIATLVLRSVWYLFDGKKYAPSLSNLVLPNLKKLVVTTPKISPEEIATISTRYPSLEYLGLRLTRKSVGALGGILKNNVLIRSLELHIGKIKVYRSIRPTSKERRNNFILSLLDHDDRVGYNSFLESLRLNKRIKNLKLQARDVHVFVDVMASFSADQLKSIEVTGKDFLSSREFEVALDKQSTLKRLKVTDRMESYTSFLQGTLRPFFFCTLTNHLQLEIFEVNFPFPTQKYELLLDEFLETLRSVLLMEDRTFKYPIIRLNSSKVETQRVFLTDRYPDYSCISYNNLVL